MNLKKTNRYKLRPGYDSKELLLEFEALIEDRSFVDDLFSVLQTGGFTAGCSADAFDYNQNWLVRFSSPHGTLDITLDEWGGIFGHGAGEHGQAAIRHADTLLKGSGRFRKLKVDFAKYRMINQR